MILHNFEFGITGRRALCTGLGQGIRFVHASNARYNYIIGVASEKRSCWAALWSVTGISSGAVDTDAEAEAEADTDAEGVAETTLPGGLDVVVDVASPPAC